VSSSLRGKNIQMTIKEILNTTEHRPWPIPSEKWKYYQEWNDVLFLHWQVDLPELQSFIPTGLEIELYNGKPWVSLVAFTMEKIRPGYLPSFPPISNFDEINIRTYVRKGNKAGVYFLSIEGGKRISCMIARLLSELPYRYSHIKREENIYRSNNDEYDDKLNIRYKPGEILKEKTELDKWLTERYALFQDTDSTINEFEIHHIEWPITKLEIDVIEIDYPRFTSLLNSSPNRLHYSAGVQVIAWDKKAEMKTAL
jgi:uncharacterized protein